MSKKVKKSSNSKEQHVIHTEKTEKDFKAQVTAYAEKSHEIITKYLLLFAVATSSLTIIIALLISQHYINPKRDEQVYNEGTSQTSFKQIDKEKLNTLEESLDNTNVEVDTDFVPNRNNPFSE